MNERSLKKRELGKVGADFVRKQLLDGGPLSERFLERLGKGHVWEFYFDGRSEAASVEEFLRGGQFDAEDCTAQGGGYVDFLISYLDGSSSKLLLFENQLARLSDPFILGRTDLFEFEGVTYFYYPSEPRCVDEPGVAGSLSSGSNYPYIMFAINAPMGMPPPQRGQISIEMANEVAAQTEHLLVGAYDGEGYIAWSRG